MGTLLTVRRQMHVTLLSILIGGVFATPALAQWGWVYEDIPQNIGEAIGSFGGAANSDGTEVYWSGQGDGPGGIGSTLTYAGSSWDTVCGTPGDPACPQGPRVGPGIGEGPDGVLLYGGLGGQFGTPAPGFGDTWLLTPGGWVEQCDAGSCGPGIRAGVAMAGNGVITVMYGGLGGSPLHDDTWVYDGTSWSQICGGMDPCGPGQLGAAVMAWDGTQFVMFGGASTLGPGGMPNDATWTLDLTTMEWTQVCGGVDPCGPAPREFAMMASSGGGGAVLLGGFNFGMAQLVYSDAWRWDGADWSPLPVPWDTTPWSQDNPQMGNCVVLPTHIVRRDNGVAAIFATFPDGAPSQGPGGVFSIFGEDNPAGGSAAQDPCAVDAGPVVSRPVPTLGNGMLAILSGLLLLLVLLRGRVRATC